MAQVFISYASAEIETARNYKRAMLNAGVASVFLSADDDSGMDPGTRWEHVLYDGLKRCRIFVPLLSPAWLNSGWCHAELRIARMLGADVVPVRIAPCDRSLLQELQHFKADLPVDDLPAEIARLIAGKLQRRGLHVPTERIFTGLLPVDVDRAAVFEGRDKEIDQLVRDTTAAARSFRLEERLIIVTGASGIGKSSLLRAGLIGTLGLGGKWLTIGPLRGRQGVLGLGRDSLAGALVPLGVSRADVAAMAGVGFAALPAVIAQLCDTARADACLLAIDQGEELLDDSEAADQLLAAITALAAEHSLPIAIVLTARDDVAVALQARLRGGALWPLAPIQAVQLAEALREPLKAAGRYDEHAEALIGAMMADVPRDGEAIGTGALPLAAYVMERLEAGGDFTNKAYQALGRLRGAIGREAEAIWNDYVVPHDLGDAMRRFFVPGMIRVDPELGVRLGQIDDVPEAISRPVELFGERRLLIRTGGSIAPAHEALLREWPRLAGWLDEERERLTALVLLVRDAAAWQQGGKRTDDLLHRGERLRNAEALADDRTYRDKIDTIGTLYIAACAERETADEGERRAREVAVAQGIDTIGAIEANMASDEKRYYSAVKVALAGVAIANEIVLLHASRVEAALARGAINCLACLRIIGHDLPVRKVVFSPDGRCVITTSNDYIARIWDADTGALLTTLNGHGSVVKSVAFSADGHRVITASGDHTARIWDAVTGAPIHTLELRNVAFSNAVFSPDGCQAVTTNWDNTARFWDATTGALLTTVTNIGSCFLGTAFSSDCSRIVTISEDNTADIWDTFTGALITTLSGHCDNIYDATFSPDGRHVITASGDHTARIWDAATGAMLTTLTGHGSRVCSATYSPDGCRVITTSWDATARIWDAATGALITNISGHRSLLHHAAFSPDGRFVATASEDNTARIWASTTIDLLKTFTGHDRHVTDAAFSPDGRRVVTASGDKTACIWDAATGALLITLTGHRGYVRSAAFSPDGRRVVTASADSITRIWDAATGSLVTTLNLHGGVFKSAAFSPDGRHIVTASDDRVARIWDVATGALLTTLTDPYASSCSAAFSPDGRLVVTAGLRFDAHIWDAGTSALVTTIKGHDWPVLSAMFSPDGLRVVTASEDNTARIWDAATGALLIILTGHSGFVRSAAFSPDGRRIVTASADGTARIWDAATGTLLAELTGTYGGVRGAAFSPDGHHIITASDDRTARIWDASVAAMSLEALVEYAATILLAGNHKFDFRELSATQLPNPPSDPVASAIALLEKRRATLLDDRVPAIPPPP